MVKRAVPVRSGALLVMMLLAVTAGWKAASAEALMGWLQHDHSAPIVARDGAELVTLEARGEEIYPRLSPDGKRMLVVARQGGKTLLSLCATDGGDPLMVVAADLDLLPASASWLDAHRVGFLSNYRDGMAFWQQQLNDGRDGAGVRRMDRRLDGQLRHALLRADGVLIAERWVSEHGDAARPGGDKITHAASDHHRSRSGAMHLPFNDWQVRHQTPYLVQISRHGAERRIAEGMMAAFSPDGQRLLFSARTGHGRDAHWHLFMMDADGSHLLQLTDGQHNELQPAWSRDGRWIVFTSNRARIEGAGEKTKENWDLWMIDRQGAHLQRLTSDPARDGGAAVATDGTIYFHSDRPISKEQAAARQLRAGRRGFHIWKLHVAALADKAVQPAQSATPAGGSRP